MLKFFPSNAFTQKLTALRRIWICMRLVFPIAWRTDRSSVFILHTAALFRAFIPFLTAYAMKLLIDGLQMTQSSPAAIIPVAVGGILAARYLISFFDNVVFYAYVQSYIEAILRYKLQNALARKFHEKMMALDLAHFEDPAVQNTINRARESHIYRPSEFFRMTGIVAVDLIAFAIAFVALIQYGWWLPLLVTVMSVPRLWVQAVNGNRQWGIWSQNTPEGKKLWYLLDLMENPMTVREARINGTGPSFMAKMTGVQDYLLAHNMKELRRQLKVSLIPPLVEGAVLFGVAWYFLPAVTSSAMTVGTFTLLLAMLDQLGQRAASASSQIGRIYEFSLYVESFADFLKLPAVLARSEKQHRFDTVTPPEIVFEDVSFAYPGSDKKALDRVSFTLKSCESFAFVGLNGAGKTTVVKLLCRFYDPQEGRILINGIDLRDLDLVHWHSHLGTLFQEFVRYQFSARENIALGVEDVSSNDKIKEAAIKAGADDFIKLFDKGYDQQLGRVFDEGVELSGGQWQKLAIARAFHAAPPVLILDEPTSAIDAEAEYTIFNNLEEHYTDKTLILVSHRFSTVRNADKIIVLENGKVVETGSHADLVGRDGLYARLFLLQAEGYR